MTRQASVVTTPQSTPTAEPELSVTAYPALKHCLVEIVSLKTQLQQRDASVTTLQHQLQAVNEEVLGVFVC